jgi:hypothetical protein
MKIALKDIRPNPYRNLERYPLSQPTVDQLVRSIQATDAGFWDNVVVRKNGDVYELAYGHHRLEAARQAGLKDADFIVKKLSDADMLKVMTLENESNFVRTQGSLLIESVEALVKAIAQGTITVELPETGTKKGALRNAPSFVVNDRKSTTSETGEESTLAYTPKAVATFLGKVDGQGKANQAVRAVVDALELCELKILKRAEVDNVPTMEGLQSLVRNGWLTYEDRQRQKFIREREEAALAEAAKRVKEAEEKRKVAAAKDAAAQAERQARIAEEAENIRIAQEEKRAADSAKEKARLARKLEDSKRRKAEEEERARKQQQEFKRKKEELDAAVEARKQREDAMKSRVEEKRAKPEEPRIPVEEPATVSEAEVLKAVEKAVEWAQKALELSRATRQRDTLALKRTKSAIEEGQRLFSKLAVKYQKA